MPSRVRELVGNTAIHQPRYHGQAGVPVHMLTLADLQELQEMQDMHGGKLNLKKLFRPIGKALKTKAAKKIVGSVIDASLPVVNKAIATSTGTNEKDVATVTGVGRKILKDKTGYGLLTHPHPDVVEYPKTNTNTNTKRVNKPTTGDDKRKRRGKLVSQLMKETGMKLADVSKYIKDNNIPY